ncbi:MAG: 50S ribosomal protein L5 [Bacteroidetes bacterium B1(2017)]|nr:MAG: 50S ribosomal protein L5 [Bacteroidetes bacterium B1(2017)]
MYTPRLKEKYAKQIVPAMQEKFGYKNSMMVPKLLKICINQGIGQAVADKKLIDQALEELSMIAGQKAVGTRSKKDISNFKLRKNVPIGTRVTLRGDRMYEFLDRLISISLPRVRDFQGLKLKGFDGRGNYNMGITEQIIFAEIVMEKVNRINGMDISFVTSATTDEQCLELLREFGFPFKKS